MVVPFTNEVSNGTVTRASKELKMHNVCACRVPCELVLEIREQVVAVQTFLTCYKKDKTELLEWAVTGDESWIHY